MTKLTHCLWVFAVLWVAGCGKVSNTEDAGIDGGTVDAATADAFSPDASIDEICASNFIPLAHLEECVLKAVCKFQSECVSANNTAAECEASRTYQFIVSFSLVRPIIDAASAEHATYDGARAAEYLNSVTQCAPSPEAADSMAPGSVGDGLACFYDQECATNGECVGGDVTNATCTAGTCEASVGENVTCGGNVYCDPGLHCVDGLCRSGGAASVCQSTSDCDIGFWCNGNGLCEVQHALGDPCTNDDQCPGASTCVGELDDSGECRTVSAVDDPCDTECVGLLYCANYIAKVQPGTCAAKPGLGGACAITDGCNSASLYCDVTCQQRPGLNQACAGNGNYCSPELVCVGGMCVEPLPVGSTCGSLFQCESFLCNSQTETCAARPECL